MTLPSSPLDAKPSLQAAVLIWALQLTRRDEAFPRTVPEVLALTGSGRSQAYLTLQRLQAGGSSLPEAPDHLWGSAESEAFLKVLRATRDFVMDHPGTVTGRGLRRRYSDGFRRFVLDLLCPDEPGQTLTRERLAEAVGVPLGTLKEWLGQRQAARAPETDLPSSGASEPPPVRELAGHPQIATILEEWSNWAGGFSAFCLYLQEEHRLPFGRTFVGSVLSAACLRPRASRRSSAPPWSRGTFCTFFPGAQWIGDGTAVPVRWNDRTFIFNFEAIVDPASDAIVGIDVTDHEDEQAVLDAFAHGKRTTSQAPLALTLDNRPSNHTQTVEETIAPTLLLQATRGRGQAKAPCEGAFGLFQQALPAIHICGGSSRDQARSVLWHLATLWSWTRNGKPRRRLGGRSPAIAYQEDRPSSERVRDARRWLLELRRRQQLSRATREARADPVRRSLLAEGLERLGVPDPEGKLSIALACYDTDAIVRGLALFAAKQDRDTLPAGCDRGRYLGGIIRNLHTHIEIECTAQHLLAQRLRQGELTLAPLETMATQLRQGLQPADQVRVLIDAALSPFRLIDYRYFSAAAASTFADLPRDQVRVLYPHLVRRIAASYRTDRDRREGLIAKLSEVFALPDARLSETEDAPEG